MAVHINEARARHRQAKREIAQTRHARSLAQEGRRHGDTSRHRKGTGRRRGRR